MVDTSISERKMSLKRDSLERKHSEKKRRASRTKVETALSVEEDVTQFGFENRAFPIILDNKLEAEQPRYCSLAQFVEGNVLYHDKHYYHHHIDLSFHLLDSTTINSVLLFFLFIIF